MEILKSVGYTVLALLITVAIFWAAGTFPHVFMGVCSLAFFLALVGIVHGIRNA